MSLLRCWAWEYFSCIAVYEGSKMFNQTYPNFCSESERRSYGFGSPWGWVIDFIFRWTIPLLFKVDSWVSDSTEIWFCIDELIVFICGVFVRRWRRVRGVWLMGQKLRIQSGASEIRDTETHRTQTSASLYSVILTLRIMNPLIKPLTVTLENSRRRWRCAPSNWWTAGTW